MARYSPGVFGSHDRIFTVFYSLTLSTPGPRKSHKHADFSVAHRKNIFRMHVATDSSESNSATVTTNLDEVQAILMRLGSRQGSNYFVFVFSYINFLCRTRHGV
jgi:hypothetical protein